MVQANALDARQRVYADIERDGRMHLMLIAKAYPMVPPEHRAFAAAMFLFLVDNIRPGDLVPLDVSRLSDSRLVHRFMRSYVERMCRPRDPRMQDRGDKVAATVMARVLKQMRPAARRVLGVWPPEVAPGLPGEGAFDGDDAVARRKLIIERARRSDERYLRMLDHLQTKYGRAVSTEPAMPGALN